MLGGCSVTDGRDTWGSPGRCVARTASCVTSQRHMPFDRFAVHLVGQKDPVSACAPFLCEGPSCLSGPVHSGGTVLAWCSESNLYGPEASRDIQCFMPARCDTARFLTSHLADAQPRIEVRMFAARGRVLGGVVRQRNTRLARFNGDGQIAAMALSHRHPWRSCRLLRLRRGGTASVQAGRELRALFRRQLLTPCKNGEASLYSAAICSDVAGWYALEPGNMRAVRTMRANTLLSKER